MIDPKAYRRMLITSSLFPLMILGSVGLTMSVIHEHHYNNYLQLAETESQIITLQNDLAQLKFFGLALMVIGVLLTFLSLAKKSKELKILRKNYTDDKDQPDLKPGYAKDSESEKPDYKHSDYKPVYKKDYEQEKPSTG